MKLIIVFFLAYVCLGAKQYVEFDDLVNGFEELYFDQIVDHFDYTSDSTWSHRYYMNADYWQKGRGVLLYVCTTQDCSNFLLYLREWAF